VTKSQIPPLTATLYIHTRNTFFACLAPDLTDPFYPQTYTNNNHNNNHDNNHDNNHNINHNIENDDFFSYVAVKLSREAISSSKNTSDKSWQLKYSETLMKSLEKVIAQYTHTISSPIKHKHTLQHNRFRHTLFTVIVSIVFVLLPG
jgi:hypothetical protein